MKSILRKTGEGKMHFEQTQRSILPQKIKFVGVRGQVHFKLGNNQDCFGSAVSIQLI